MTSNWTRRGPALGSLLALIALLHAAGGALASPPLDPGDFANWWTNESPVIALASLLRPIALAGSGWLAAITALDCLAVAARMHPLQRLTARVVPAVWRNLVLRPMTLSAVAVPQVFVPVATMSPVAAEPIEAPTESNDLTQEEIQVEIGDDGSDGRRVLEMRMSQPTPPMAIMSLVDPSPEPRSGSGVPPEPDHDGEAPELTAIDAPDPNSEGRNQPEASPGTASPTEILPITRVISMTMHSPPSEAHIPPSPQPMQREGVHVVASGQNLWSIAANHLASERDEPVSTAEVAGYWQRLIDENRDALPDPDNPDLLYRGVELRLPPTG